MTIFLLMFLARGADLFSTWVRDPELNRETNPLVRMLRWRLNLWLNFGIVIASPFLPIKFAVCLIVMSFLAAAWNSIGIVRDSYEP
jgi:hypothetical protein